MNIVFVHSNHRTDQYQVLQRCKIIAAAIERTGLHHAALVDMLSFVSDDESCQKLCSEADMLVIHRYAIGQVLHTALAWKARGKKIVLDMDEAVNLIPEEMEQHRFWTNGEVITPYPFSNDPAGPIKPNPLQQLSWGVTLMDAVTVSSRRLAGDWQGTGRVWEVPDYLDFNQYLMVKKHQENEIWIGMGGRPVSQPAIEKSGLMNAVENICRERPQVRLVLANMPPDLINHTDIPRYQGMVYSWLPPEDWTYYLSNLDIGLAPAFGEYDLRASHSRILEYMAARIPWIASDHLPYRDMGEYGVLVQNDQAAWFEALITMIDSLSAQRARAGGKPYLYAASQDINENVGKLVAVYESILNQ